MEIYQAAAVSHLMGVRSEKDVVPTSCRATLAHPPLATPRNIAANCSRAVTPCYSHRQISEKAAFPGVARYLDNNTLPVCEGLFFMKKIICMVS